MLAVTTDLPTYNDLRSLYNSKRRDALVRIYGKVCFYCGVSIFQSNRDDNRLEPRAMTVDHVIPRAQGGLNRLSNYVLACNSCNQKKATETVSEFIYAQLSVLGEPYRSIVQYNYDTYLLLNAFLKEYEKGVYALEDKIHIINSPVIYDTKHSWKQYTQKLQAEYSGKKCATLIRSKRQTRIRKLINVYGQVCFQCGKNVRHVENAHSSQEIPHDALKLRRVVPRERGGSNDVHNFVLSCHECSIVPAGAKNFLGIVHHVDTLSPSRQEIVVNNYNIFCDIYQRMNVVIPRKRMAK